jgi:transposase InsO family protein
MCEAQKLFRTEKSIDVTKLTDRKIRLFCVEIVRERMTCQQAAALYGVSVRRVQQLVRQYRQSKEVPKLNEARRPKAPPPTKAERELIEEYWQKYRFGSRHLFHVMRSDGIQIPHHKVRSYLVQTGRVLPCPNKQKQRKRCRYEREHSFSLVHGDWHRRSLDAPHVIVWIDDASRLILAGGEYDEETMENTIESMQKAIDAAWTYHAFIKEVNTDRGVQFFCNHPKDEKKMQRQATSKNGFQLFLEANNIRHVVSRVNNPQTNGKCERFWLEYDRHRAAFGSMDEFIDWYNHRMHGALLWDIAETPAMAVQRKLQPEASLGRFWEMVEC